jgi:hypothetical protein
MDVVGANGAPALTEGKIMAKTTVTTTATVGTLPEGIPARLVDSVVHAFTERATVHVSRTRAIGALIERGLSVRGVVATVSAYTGGAVPSGFSKSNVSRYAQVWTALKREDVLSAIGERPAPADKAARAAYDAGVQSITADLFRIAGDDGGAADVKRAADRIAGSQGMDAGILAAGIVAGEIMRKTAARVAAPVNRPVGGEAADGGRQALAPAGYNEMMRDADEGPQSAPEVAPTTGQAPTAPEVAPVPERTATEVLSSVGVSALIAELSRRFKGRAATVAASDVDALSALISRVSALIESDKVTR